MPKISTTAIKQLSSYNIINEIDVTILMNCFVLSTPDLSASPLTAWISQLLTLDDGALQTDLANSIHQDILQKLQKSWYEEIPPITNSANYSSFQESIKPHAAQFSNHDTFNYDPLLCHFLPAWLTSIKHPKIFLQYSEPLSCALKLQHSWRMPLAVGLALWESYMIQACKNIVGLDYILLSFEEIIRSSETYLAQVSSYLGKDQSQLTNTQFSEPLDSNSTTRYHDQSVSCVQDSQTEILALLKSGDVGAIANRELAYSSTNTLEYYGQLRGALELANKDRDHYKNKIIENKMIPQMHPVDNIDTNSPSQSDSTQGQLCNVKVQIKGMKTLEFMSPTNSPILDMLRKHLVHHNGDELIYLNYGESGNETLYFMSSSLLAIETQLA